MAYLVFADSLSHEALFNGISVNVIHSGASLEVYAINLIKHTNYSIDSTRDPERFKTYYIVSGSAYFVEEARMLRAGDLLIVSELDEQLNLYVMEDIKILFMSNRHQNFEALKGNISNVAEILKHIQEKDAYTDEHCDRVFTNAIRLAIIRGFKGDHLANLMFAARYHDLGKIHIPDAILNKPGKLTTEEYELMKTHVMYGADYIKAANSSEIFTMVAQHHERFDGSGYPNGLKKDEISEGGQILAICDCYDAMTSNRVYKTGKSKQDAVDEIQSLRGVHFDPLLVDAFLHVLDVEFF